MARVYCAATECMHNSDCCCTAREITLNDGHAHTLHQGFMHHWICTNFEESKRAKQMREAIEKYRQEVKK